MVTYFGVTYDEKISDSTSNLADDVEKTLSELLPDGNLIQLTLFIFIFILRYILISLYLFILIIIIIIDYITNYDIFLQRVQADAETFVPMGEKISEYHMDDDDDKVYEIYKVIIKDHYS